MTLQEWQSNPALAEELRKALELPILRMAQEVIESMSPTRQIGVLKQDVIQCNSQFWLGKIDGYHERERAYGILTQVFTPPPQPVERYRGRVEPENLPPGGNPPQRKPKPK